VTAKDGSRTLGWPLLMTLWVIGMGLIAAVLLYGLMFFIGLMVGLSEPTQPTGMQWKLIWAYVLAGTLVLATGVYCLLCWTRRRLWVLGGLAVAAVAAVGLCFHLYPKAERSVCEQFIAKQRDYGPDARVDTSCLADA
jgi:hypothetical protein